MKQATTLLLLLSLTGCATASRPKAWNKPGKVGVYECDQEIEFVIDSQPDTAWLFLSGQTVALPRIRSGSGARYSNDRISFWSKGSEALLELPGDRNYHCQENRARSIWEDAKLRGVDFRAVGQEPGWHLEIGPDAILLVTAYGQHEKSYPLPAPNNDQQARQTTYSTEDLTILLEGQPCHDTMSGESYETTVTLTVGTRTLEGCGRALH